MKFARPGRAPVCDGKDILQRCRTKSIESESFLRMYNGQFAGHSQHCAFARGVGKLWGSAANERYNRSCVDDTTFCLLVSPHTKDGMF